MNFDNIVMNVLGALYIMMLIGFVIWFGIITETYMMMIGALMIMCLGPYLYYLQNK